MQSVLLIAQARFLLAKLNPSSTHESQYGGGEIIFTDDVSLQVHDGSNLQICRVSPFYLLLRHAVLLWRRCWVMRAAVKPLRCAHRSIEMHATLEQLPIVREWLCVAAGVSGPPGQTGGVIMSMLLGFTGWRCQRHSSRRDVHAWSCRGRTCLQSLLQGPVVALLGVGAIRLSLLLTPFRATQVYHTAVRFTDGVPWSCR